MGHHVTLFATSNSITSANLHSEAPAGYEEDPDVDAKVYESLHIAAVFERAREFDVLSNHFDFGPIAYSRLVETPMVTTIHGFSSERILPIYRKHNDVARYVSISNADRHQDLTYEATIYHGIELANFTFKPTAGDYLLFLGRFHPDKGAHRAIEVARKAGQDLVLAGIIQDQKYFHDEIAPHIDNRRVRYLGQVESIERDILLGGALALLHLISFSEPFGLSVVEALATGTPVIAHPLGSLPEIIRHTKTGFLVEDIQGAVDAVGLIQSIKRQDCRDDAENRFSALRMVEDYSALFERVVSETPSAASRSKSKGRSTKAKRIDESLTPYGNKS